ncbi:hypothetical protein V2G26_011141 [Clonostachys chloroleuca]
MLSEIPEELPEVFQVALFLETLPVDFCKQVLSKGVPSDWKELLNQGVIAETLIEASKTSGIAQPRSHPRHHNTTTSQETRPTADTRTLQRRGSDRANYRWEYWKYSKPGHTRDYWALSQILFHTSAKHNRMGRAVLTRG